MILFEKYQIDDNECQHNAGVYDKPFPEVIPEEKYINADDNGYHN